MTSDHSKHHGATHGHSPKSAVHKDWRLWTAVVLALIAMATYLATLDESILPDGSVGPEVPIEAAP